MTTIALEQARHVFRCFIGFLLVFGLITSNAAMYVTSLFNFVAQDLL